MTKMTKRDDQKGTEGLKNSPSVPFFLRSSKLEVFDMIRTSGVRNRQPRFSHGGLTR